MAKPYKAVSTAMKLAGKRGARWEIVLPAATAILTLIIGAEINAFEARRLERQKFQFEVLKFTFSAGDDTKRIKLLCQFADLNFIDDINRKYRRKEIGGSRPCSDAAPGHPFGTSSAYVALRDQIGTESKGEISLESGFLQVGGGLADYHNLRDATVVTKPVKKIIIGALAAAPESWTDGALRADPKAASSHLIIQRDGHFVQPRNLFDRADNAPVVVRLQTAGRLSFGAEGRGPMFKLYDQFGRPAERVEGVGFISGVTTVGR